MTGASRPDFRHGYLRVPLAVWMTLFCRGLLTRRQLQLACVVLRESWGWRGPDGEVRAWTRRLTTRQFAAATGLSTDHLRRDLSLLVRSGVLREAEGCYQLVPAPRLWTTALFRPPKRRSPPPKSPAAAAVSALSTPGVKTGKISKENGPPAPGGACSPPVDNSPSRPSSRPSSPAPAAAREQLARKRLVRERLVRVIAAFAGPLPAVQAGALARWIDAEGVAAVWIALEPALRRGPAAARRRLELLLAIRERPEHESTRRTGGGEAADA